MYSVKESGLAAVDWKEALQPLVQTAVPATMDVLVPELLSYLNSNRYKVWTQAKPVLENISSDERIREEARPILQRVFNRERGRYGKDTFYPKYGKYAAPAIGVGAGLLVGSFGAGALALKTNKEEEKGSNKATALLGVTYFLGLSGIGLVIAGAVLSAGNWLFPKK